MNGKDKKNERRIQKLHIFLFAVIIVKIVLAGMFSSDYQNKMFMPFVSEFLDGIMGQHNNPYDYYYNHSLPMSFPYPTFMLIFESIGMGIIKLFHVQSVFLSNLLFKLPIFLFDFTGLFYLLKLFPKRTTYISIFYFSSPIIVYADYMHGQLDIIPIAILVMAIYYLLKDERKSLFLFALLLSIAIMTKQSMAALAPLLILYLYKKKNLKTALLTLFGISIFLVVFSLPFYGTGFVNSVLFNAEQAKLMNVYLDYNGIRLYLPICAVVIFLVRVLLLDRINKNLLFSFCGMLFAVILAFVPPMPGWYVWIIPFISVVFANFDYTKKQNNFILYGMFHVVFLAYFVFFHKTKYIDLYFLDYPLEFLKIDNPNLRNLSFSLLSGILYCVIYFMYNIGIKSNSLYKWSHVPFTIGISGDSGSGKSTLLDNFFASLGKNNILYLEGDGDHRWERNAAMWETYTHLNPKANYLYRQSEKVAALRHGNSVMHCEYNHDTGKFEKEHMIKPKKYIIMCGLHALYLPGMRKNLDLKIYLDTDENLKNFWKIRRDVGNRGYSFNTVQEQIKTRNEDYVKYVLPQKKYADIIIQYFDTKLYDNSIVEGYEPCVSVKYLVPSCINIEPLIWTLEENHINVKYDFTKDLEKQIILLDGQTLKQNFDIPFDKVGYHLIQQFEEIAETKFIFDNLLDGITQLILLVVISSKMKGEF